MGVIFAIMASSPSGVEAPARTGLSASIPSDATTARMKRAAVIKLLAFVGILAAPALQGQIFNLHDASQGYSHYGGYNVLMYGQGAAADHGNNIWNGFGKYGAPGSTDFYGVGNPDSGHGSVPNGNPGQPYAWHSGTSAGGPNLFSPTNPGAPNTGNATSAGTISPITVSLTYGFDNGADGGIAQGQPSWILSHAAVVNGANPLGSVTLNNVPIGTYDLFLYGANFDGTRGASFTITTGGGTAVGGITSTINPNAAPTGSALNAFVLGVTYVEFTGVVPVGGVINATWGAVSNPNSGLSGEGDFNGLQLVQVIPEPSTLAMLGFGLAGWFTRRRCR
jgi:PEP-CTERM motif